MSFGVHNGVDEDVVSGPMGMAVDDITCTAPAVMWDK
jgi:hypothetical protein